MKDKFNLTQEQERLLVTKNYYKLVHYHAVLEGLAVTLPETETILKGGTVTKLGIEATNLVLGLGRAWRMIIQDTNSLQEIDIKFLSFMHYLLMQGVLPDEHVGRLSQFDVRISGTSWKPKMPNPYEVNTELLNRCYWNMSKTEIALELFCYIVRAQAFVDGNKRTAFLVANYVLVKCNLGYLQAPTSKTFKEKLISFYETGDNEDLKGYLYKYYLKGA